MYGISPFYFILFILMVYYLFLLMRKDYKMNRENTVLVLAKTFGRTFLLSVVMGTLLYFQIEPEIEGYKQAENFIQNELFEESDVQIEKKKNPEKTGLFSYETDTKYILLVKDNGKIYEVKLDKEKQFDEFQYEIVEKN